MNNQTQIHSIDIDDKCLNLLPEKVRGVLNTMENQERVAFKGGIAKLCLMAAMMNYGNFKDEARWQLEQKISDIDLVFIFLGDNINLKELFIERFERIKKIFYQKDVHLNPKDIDIIEEIDLSKAITKILTSDDLTINEVVLIFSAGGWKIFYTPFALKHLAQGVGMFIRPKTTNLYYSAGRVFPSALGMIRLIKFLVAGKVNKIYLPRWWLTLYMENYQKKVAAGEMPPNAPLGFYSLVLLKNYFGDKPLLQKKAMVALYDLGFTDMLDPELYIRQQEAIFCDADKEFALKDFTIEEVFDRYLENRRKKEESKKNRQAARANCVHEFKIIDCDLCGRNRCVIETCSKCGKNKTNGFLPCTMRFYAGQTDPSGFYELK